jgi:hypothetical protein
MRGWCSKAEKVVETDPKIVRIAGEISDHHLAWKSVVPCWQWSVGGENVGGSCDLKGGVKTELLLRDEPPNPLEAEKGGVAFVHVENVRLDPKRAQSVA